MELKGKEKNEKEVTERGGKKREVRGNNEEGRKGKEDVLAS